MNGSATGMPGALPLPCMCGLSMWSKCGRWKPSCSAAKRGSGNLPSNAKVSGPEAALSPEGRARLPGYASVAKTEE